MSYSRAFFGFQLHFVQQLVDRFALDWADTLQHYTTFTRTIADEHRENYLSGIQATADATEWAYQWDRVQRAPGPQPLDTTLYGRALFGCFHYSIHNDRHGNATIIRPHFIKNDRVGLRPLGQERLAERRAEVYRMFTHIHEHVPAAITVSGHSWLYNLAAYRRIYPPLYTHIMAAVTHDEFQHLSLWGQCFDRHWQPKPAVTDLLLQRLAVLEDIAKLRFCFPYQVRLPQCKIDEFYTYFGIAERCDHDGDESTAHRSDRRL